MDRAKITEGDLFSYNILVVAVKKKKEIKSDFHYREGKGEI